jgi:signal transduction histidine kinase
MPADATPTAAGDVEAAVRTVELASVRSLTLWLAPMFALFAPFDWFASGPAGPVLALQDIALALVYAGLHLWARRPDAERHAHLAGGLMAAAVLPYQLANLWVTGDPVFAAGLALWQVGIGIVLLHWGWVTALLAISNVAYGTVAWQLAPSNPSSDWVQYGFILVSATVIGLVAHGVRLRTIRRLEGLRLAERARRLELEQAQAAAREVEAVRRANELKTEFINTAAHELNTPLTPILLQMRLLRRSLADGTPEQSHALDIMERNLERLRELLADVLDSARLQADRLPIRPEAVDLAGIAQAVVHEYGSTAKASGVQLRLDAPPTLSLQGDPKRLHQVVANLVSNALKHTPVTGRVTVRVAAADGHARLEVEDTGPGIPAPQHARLFQPFSRVHDGGPHGTGLGLYICRSIVERHGGTIGVADAPGSGARFWVQLPR